ncbi:Nitroreductase-like protein [Tribonema minus]|uniref:Nitroreductase-like protein n=1 Tax=Tribonema minus TaxID=303371 RepID=A0A835Z5B9_9STRA|nr:Nitroreductase-like protein [Tribonema minus]
MASAAATAQDLSQAFKAISDARYANKEFSPEPVPAEVLQDLLQVTLRAPSAFNVQPYKALVINSPQSKQLLSKAMLSTNKKRVLDAGATVVFAADKNCMKDIGKVVDMFKEGGSNAAFVRKIPLYVAVFSSGHNRVLRPIMTFIKQVVFSIARRLGLELPPVNSAEAWAFKNTMLAVEAFMLAAAANGLATCPMEGFDPRQLRKQFHIPRRYSVPVVVSIGYPKPSDRPLKQSRRFPPEQVFYDNQWGQGMAF